MACSRINAPLRAGMLGATSMSILVGSLGSCGGTNDGGAGPADAGSEVDARPAYVCKADTARNAVRVPDQDLCCAFHATEPPAPIDWVPCSGFGVDCRKDSVAGAVMAAWRTADDRVLLAMARFTTVSTKIGSGFVDNSWVVTDADGPGRQALEPVPPPAAYGAGSCYLDDARLVDGRVLWTIRYATANEWTGARSVAFVGAFDELPRAVRAVKGEPGDIPDYQVAPSAVFEWSAKASRLLDWDGREIATIDAIPSGGVATVVDGAVFMNAWKDAGMKIARWTRADGVRPLLPIRPGSIGAKDLQTDGVDMVWIEQTGATTFELVTSPFTTDPATIQSRSVRSIEEHGSKLIVGCGHVARETDAGVRIVRLSDGASWMLRNSPTYRWRAPVALTCSELFLHIRAESEYQTAPYVVRVRLDRLGPLHAAD